MSGVTDAVGYLRRSRDSVICVVQNNLMVQFSLVCLLITVVVASALALVQSRSARSSLVSHSVNEAVDVSTARVIGEITPADLETAMTGERYVKFDEFVRRSIISRDTARVKLWSTDGTIVYSDDPTAVGDRFAEKAGVLAALRGEITTIIGVPQGVDNLAKMDSGELMEIYAPIVFPDAADPAGVLEIYRRYSPIEHRIGVMSRWVFGSVAGGFLVLYLSMVLVVNKGWNTITLQRIRLEAARARLEQSEGKAQRAAWENKVVGDIGRIVGSTLDIDEAYKRLAAEIRTLIPFDRIAIFAIDFETGMSVSYID